ncbi:MAG: sugar-binding domain-containing protein, partial [Enterococcus hulanensis]
LCYEFARKTRSSSKYLYTPALVSNPAIRKEFENNEYIHEILEEAKQVDLAIVSISSPYHINTMQEIGYLSETDIQELYDLHVVGDINSRFFDKDGVEVNHVTNTNVIGIGIEDLKNIPQVVALAYHEDKWSGVYYSCKNHLITDLI